MRPGDSYQPAAFHERIRPSPHSCFDRARDALRDALRQRAERIAVEIVHALRQHEARAGVRERVGAVESEGGGAGAGHMILSSCADVIRASIFGKNDGSPDQVRQ